MSFRVRDFQRTNNSQLSKSKSKQKYSFTKDKRFQYQKANEQFKYYCLPSTNQLKTSSFGCSERKTIFEDYSRKKSSSPDYNPISELKMTNNMISFPASRQMCKAYSFIKIDTNPGPGSYNPKAQLKNTKMGSKFNMKKKDLMSKSQLSDLPGPGTYYVKSWIQKNRILSTEKYQGGTLMFPSKSRRTLDLGINQINSNVTPLNNPNLNYRAKQIFNKTGVPFGKSLRFRERNKTQMSPGPGSYHQYSEFV